MYISPNIPILAGRMSHVLICPLDIRWIESQYSMISTIYNPFISIIMPILSSGFLTAPLKKIATFQFGFSHLQRMAICHVKLPKGMDHNWLVVWLPFFIFPLILGCDYHPNWRSHIFQRGGPTTNQVSSWCPQKRPLLLEGFGSHVFTMFWFFHRNKSKNMISPIFPREILLFHG